MERTSSGMLNWGLAQDLNPHQEVDMIKDGSRVKLHYILKVDGDVVDSSEGQEPLTYVHGSGQLVPALEEELEGRSEGDRMGVRLPPERAYGPWNPDAVRNVPIEAFGDPERITVGTRVTGVGANGEKFEASVTGVGEEEVTIDLNHPLAGKALEFDVEVIEVS